MEICSDSKEEQKRHVGARTREITGFGLNGIWWVASPFDCLMAPVEDRH